MSRGKWSLAETSRFYSAGLDDLNLTELLALLLRSQQAALNLVAQFPTLRGVTAAPRRQLTAIAGIGRARAEQLLVCFELGRRAAACPVVERPRMCGPEDLAHVLGPQLASQKQEVFLAVLLTTKNSILSTERIAIGSLNSAVVHAREVFARAIELSAASVVLVHNHPSGDPEPSPEDVRVTERMAEAGQIIGIKLLDHVVIGDGSFVSMKERGLLPS